MLVSDIELYELLKNKMGEKEAQTLVAYVKSEINILATKEDLANIKADLIKWMFIFWIGSIATLSGIMVAILNAYLT